MLRSHEVDSCFETHWSLGIDMGYGFLQNGLATKVEKSRKQMKERKNRAKKIRGVKKVFQDILGFLFFS